MNESDCHVANQVRLRVWSGFCDPVRVEQVIDSLLDPKDDRSELRRYASEQFRLKQEAEQTWPETTDCDRLFTAFLSLNSMGIIAVHDAGWDKSEAFHNCLQQYKNRGEPQEIFGVCYYTEQDVDDAIENHSMHLGFSSSTPEREEIDSPRTAKLICQVLTENGIQNKWDEVSNSRIQIDIDWKWRNFTE